MWEFFFQYWICPPFGVLYILFVCAADFCVSVCVQERARMLLLRYSQHWVKAFVRENLDLQLVAATIQASVATGPYSLRLLFSRASFLEPFILLLFLLQSLQLLNLTFN